LLFLLAVSTPVFYNNVDFSIYNPGWNGCSDIAVQTYEEGKLQPTYFVKQSELTIGQKSFSDFDLNSEKSSILIIGPQSSFSDEEAEFIINFLNDGGILFLADDFGSGNDLLSKINSSSRFTNDLLLDLSFEKKASFVTVFDFINHSHPLNDNVSHILLNYPSSIQLGDNSLVLAMSTDMSWLDINENGKEDSIETKGPFPILVVELYGDGQIILFSGPSVLINSMKNQLDNEQFRNNLLDYIYAGRSNVLIDESHREDSSPFNMAYIFPASIGWDLKIAILALLVCLFVLGFTSIPRYIWKKLKELVLLPKKELEEGSNKHLVDEVLLKHPDWSKKKLEEILRGYEYEKY